MATKPPITEFPPRIETRVVGKPHLEKLRDIALRPEVQDDMLVRIRRGEKPVTALSAALLAELGEQAKGDQLRRLAGEMTAHVVENRFDCVRSTGARLVPNDPVFTSGTPFKEGAAPAGDPVVAVLIAAMPDDQLRSLVRMASDEIERRAA